jgi:hypothetical protein
MMIEASERMDVLHDDADQGTDDDEQDFDCHEHA